MDNSSDNFGADRKGRRGELDYRYDFLFHWAAECCSITKQDVIDSLLQEIQVRDIHDFVLRDTKRTLLLFYQAIREESSWKSRTEKNKASNLPNKTVVSVNEDKKYPLEGIAIFYFKLNIKKMLTEDNVHRDLMVGYTDAVDDELLSSFIQLLKHVYRPALESLLFFADDNPDKNRVYEEVLMTMQSVYSSLRVSESILKHDNKVLSHMQLDLDLPTDPKMRTDCMRLLETVAKAEKMATDWLSMIERENCESEMLRRDSDDDSPRDEIEYWKTRSTRLNLIQQQFNSPQVALVIQCLNVNRSKMMRRWVDALRKLTHCCHEANNNTLYLNDFEHHCKTLYVWDPIRLLPNINQLLSTVRLICCVSLYYNTSERITSLLVKITNELIRSCRRHITNHGRETVWSRPASAVKPLLEDCLNLHAAYRNAYTNMKNDLEAYQKSVQRHQQNPKEQAQLTCSEHSVFGKFDAFCSRLQKILRLYDVIDKHESLLKNRMEGLLQEEEVMDEILRRYHAAVKDITSRPYDYLNHRMAAFDHHMSEFEARLNDLKLYVGGYLERAYDPVWETAQAIRFLNKFQRIGSVIPVVSMEVKHQRILNQLLADMDRLCRVINRYGEDPPIPKNFSSITGKMMWCATLQRCLETRLEEHAPILNSEIGRIVFRKYRSVVVNIVQLGNYLLRNWNLLTLSEVESCLSQAILIPNAEQPHLFTVNFSSRMIVLFQEIHCACQAGIRIPIASAFVYSRKAVLLRMKDEAQYLVENHRQLIDSISSELKPLLCCHVHQLYLTLRPASTSLSWNIKQTKWTRFFTQCRKAMESFKLLCQRLEDIRANQLERILESLRHFSLYPENRDRTWMPDEFIEAVKEATRKATMEIQQRNWLLENGVIELIDLIRVKDVTKFFIIVTESIASESSGKLVIAPPQAIVAAANATAAAMAASTTGTPSSLRPRSSVGPNKSRVDAVPEENHKGPSRPPSGRQDQRKRSVDLRASLPPLNGISSSRVSTTKPPPSSKISPMSSKLPKLSNAKRSPPVREKSVPTSLPPLTARSGSSSFSTAHGDEPMLLHQQSVVATRNNSIISSDGNRKESDTAAADNTAVDYGFLVVQLEKAIVEWKRQYAKRILQVIVTWLRSQLDQLRYSIVPPSNHKVTASSTAAQHYAALFLLQAQLNDRGNGIEMSPSLDDIQEVIHSAGKTMLSLAKGIRRWQQRPQMELKTHALSAVQKHNIYTLVSENKEVVKGMNQLSTCLIHVRGSYAEQLRQWDLLCKEICCSNRRSVVKIFNEKNPSVWDWDQQLRQFRQLEETVETQKSLMEFGPIHVSTTKLQATLLSQIQEWMEAYTSVLYRKSLRDMERLMVVFGQLDKKLDRKIRDLDDTRIAMDCLRDIRLQEVEFEMAIELVEEAIGIMMKYHVPLTEEDIERVDAVRMTWHRLQQRSLDHHCNLVAIQPNFRQELLDNLNQFTVDCGQFCEDYERDGPMIQGLTPREASDRLLLFQNRFDALWRRVTSYEGGAELFGLTMPDVPELNRIRKELNLLQKLYRLYNDVIDRVAAYHDISWNSVNIEDINNELIEFQNRCRKLPKGLKEWPAFGALKRTIDEFSDLCPLLELMTNKAMKPRHWVRMTEITGHVFHVELEGFCLRQVVEAPLLQHKEDVEDVCISALKEKDIEAKLRQVTNDWTTNQLTFATFKNRGELLLRGDSAAELIAMLEDSLMVLSSLLSNRYNVPFRKQIQKWVTDLSNTNEILERWLMVQNLWVYLEAVFVGGDIAKQLPKEAKRFHKIDKSWQRLMARAHETNNVVICCVGDETLTQLLPHLQDELELCQKSLSGYLEKKRLSFPRFFFVSDPALLEILGQASDSHTIQTHLLSIFDNTACVRFHEVEYDKILAIVSTEGESIALEQPVRAEGSVELWLMRLLQEAHRSLHSIIRLASQAIQNPDFNLLDFLAAFPSQVGILGLQMLWTRDAEAALAQCRYDRKVMQETNAKFLEVLNTLIEQTTKNLDKLERIKFETLITIHVHQRDIFDQLCRSGVRSVTDFEWIKQFRFYFRAENDQMNISITDVNFTYQNEFLGCTERLVITPLTDRCYITLAQALHMCMGGCPSGPAGTGKTETTKDMGKTLGKYVVVFNCSDQMDFRGLGRIYKGLAQSGSWGCFDEFNRIELAVLSVAAQQIAVVLACKREKRKQLIFTDGDTIDMNPEFGIFLTMNPGYAGRQQLPENLKNQFRFVSMMVPDRQIIIRVKLASCGFLENITLARKFYTLYKLCEEQLTKQVHYDFGLRNILSVLRTLGATKRANVRDSESMIVMRVLRDMNLSKLVDEDEPLFMSLIGDLFPTTALEKTSYGDLEAAIRDQVKAAGLIMHPPWILKLIQLYETQLVRHGIMTLGPTGSGKTTCIQILMKALTACGQAHREMRMNPKAISAAQMFGRLDVATNDWTDGIFSALWRKTLRTKRGEHIWLVLDGPVDSLWIENLNSVLDDNRTLTLANGDRLPMSPYCKIIFEPHNIDNASPATVSRCGMVYMSSSGLDWRPLLLAWLHKRPAFEMDVLRNCFESSFAAIYQWSRQNLIYKMDVLECNIINQALCLLEGLIPKEDDHKESNYDRGNGPLGGTAPSLPQLSTAPVTQRTERTTERTIESSSRMDSTVEPLDLKSITDPQPDTSTAPGTAKGFSPRSLKLQLERLYVFAVVWSIGALLEKEDRVRLDAHISTHYPQLALPPKRPGSEDIVFDFVVTANGEWDHWKNHVPDFQYPETAVVDFASMLVPNVDSVRTEFLLHTIAKQGRPVLLIGEQGSAKTVMINNYLKKNKNEENLIRSLNFSSATTTAQFQRTVEGCVDKRMGNTYGPPAGKKLTIFIDDINLPYVNEWGDQATNEIVRQLLEMKGFYSLEKPGDFTNIIDLQFVSAMIHPGGGRNDIPQRLKRHFFIFNCPLPSNTSMDKVFGTIALGHFSSKRGFSQEVRELVEKLVPLTRLLWMTTKAKMLPTPAKFHYIFNLRDLSRIWQGMSSFLCTVIDTPKILMAAWKHEVCRVIADRFTSQADKDWFEKELIAHVTRHLADTECIEAVQQTQYFVDFMRDAPEPTGDETEEVDMELPKVYEPVSSLDDLQERLTMFMAMYNDMIRGHGMDLVFFQDAMEHLIKISRILRHPGGNVLLIGVGGSGKQSLTKLASFIAGYKTFHISLTRSYNVANFLEDLKVLYRTCGIQGKGTTFIFTDQDVKEEAFLEYLNSVLSSGIVSNLFNRDEQSEIVSELTPVMKREFPKRDLTHENVMEYFMTRVRHHLHIALCFSPVGEKFRQRAFKFPGLTSGCTLDWFQPWPREALVAVARHFLKDFNLLESEMLSEVENALGSIQESVAETAKEYFQRFRRSTHVTPKTYLSFLSSYKAVFSSKASEIGGMSYRIETGLAKLEDASEAVEKLKMDLVVMEQELARASETAETVLIEVTQRAREAEATKNQVQLAKDRAQRLVDVIAADKAVAEQKLEAARPALEEAEAALNTIKPAHIATVRKLGRPPPLIMRIMDAVLILFQRKIVPVCHDPAMGGFRPSWSESLKLMSSTTFLQMLQNFPKDTISDETVELLEPYFRAEDYYMEMAKRVCGDVAGLLSWTRAMAFFFSVNKEVLPLKSNLALQEVRLSAAMAELAKAEAILLDKETALNLVTSQYDAAMGDKKRLTEQAAVCRRKMAIAASLISGLSGEKLRWTLQCRAFKEQISRLVGDAILATAFLSYAGPFNQEFRAKIMLAWKKTLKNRDIPFTPTLNVTQMMTDNVQMSEWTLQGLPSDEHSIQNAVIVVRSHSYPLLIDPQGQGKNWIKAKEGNNELQITSLNHKYFRAHLDDALSLGRPLLIEDVGEELDPVLDNLLNKNFIRSGSTDKVIIGDKDCDIMPGFTLYITTKLPNPAYTPEVSSKVTMIDFTVTQRGLEDQLLARVVSTERSELESERVSLFESVMENKRLIQQLEDNLLFRLTSTTGSLIDDEDLLGVLHDTKVTAMEVNHKLTVAAEMEHKINNAREEFRPVATRGSILYFLIVEMSQVNVMYQTSLRQFLHLFDGSLTKATRTPNIIERVNSILSTLNREVWVYTLRGLYEQHQFLFTLLMAIKIDLHAGTISHAEFMKLIKGGASLDLNTAPPKPYKWVLDAVWLNLVELSTVQPFTDLLQQVHENEREWRSWVEKERPEMEEIPCGYSKSLSSVAFRKLLLIRSWCPDRMLQSAQNYVVQSLGPLFIDSPLLDLEAMWSESDPRVPLICILTTCSDPSQKIEQLARTKEVDIKALSMGQGQEIHARRFLQESMSNGNWLLLQNCHLNLAFCNELLESLIDGEVMQPTFRLWITTEVHPQFPISLLQTAIKFTNEPPQGIRASMKRTFTDLPQDLFDYSPSPAWPTLVYTLAFLHTVLLERRKYGPLGWNTIYEFNQSDLMGAIQCVQNHLDDMDPRKGISWPTICFMIGEAQYGGRVTDDFDKRLLLTFTSLWFSDRLLTPNFEFYHNYSLPSGAQAKSIPGCMEHIALLPANDSPHVLGLDANADVTYQMNRAQAILDTILSIQPKEGASIRGGETRENVVYRLADDMLEKMPKNYVDHEVKEALNRMGPLLPMSIFLRQEIDRMQRVLRTVRKVLQDLKLAIDGTIIMSPHLLQAMDAMYDARVPEMWKNISWESSTLGFWFTELLERNAQFTKWCYVGKPKVFWIAGFFNPQGFLTAMRQEVTRAHRGWALDSVVLQSIITRLSKEEVLEHPAEGVYVHGMYLEGASLDRKTGKLVETKAKILYEPMPVIYVYAINSTAGKDPKMYECPIYRKPIRSTTTYIGSIDLETDINPKHWTLRGVALLCDIK